MTVILQDLAADSLVVLDLFLSSGTTLLACQQMERRCLGMELSPQYCQVTLDRWEQFTGQKAHKVGEAVRPPVTHGSVTRERTETKARSPRTSPAGRGRRPARARQQSGGSAHRP